MQVTANDPDYSHNQIKYFIDRDLNNDWSFFSIDQASGSIFTKIVFDYETKTEYTLRIIAQDTGIMIDEKRFDFLDSSSNTLNDGLDSYVYNLTTSLVIRIKVDDLDDNEPEFSSSYRFNQSTFSRNISDTLEKKSTVTILPLALDRDAYEQNTRVKYFILDGNHDRKFDLNETSAELTLNDELDFKVVNSYELIIRATSKYSLTDLKNTNLNENPNSLIKVVLNVVKDKLVIEFDQSNYYVSLKLNTSTATSDSLRHSMNIRKRDNSNTNLKTSLFNNASDLIDFYMRYDDEKFKLAEQSDSSLFFARAHLMQRKFNRIVRFNIDMLQLIRANEQSSVKLSKDNLVHVIDMQKEHVSFDDDNRHLFFIDSFTGNIYFY